MIDLRRPTSTALLFALMRQNYNISWRSPSDRKGFFAAGMHLPTGEVAYYIPEDRWHELDGMITLESTDHWDVHTAADMAKSINEWQKTL